MCRWVAFANSVPPTEAGAGTVALCRSCFLCLSLGVERPRAPPGEHISSPFLSQSASGSQAPGSHSISSPQSLFWVMLFIFGPLENSITLLQAQLSFEGTCILFYLVSLSYFVSMSVLGLS